MPDPIWAGRTWTNKSGIAAPIVAAILDDDYNPEGSDITVTSLIEHPFYVKMRNLAAVLCTEEDVADRLYALYGKIVHKMLEDGAMKLKRGEGGELGRVVRMITPPVTDIGLEERLHCVDGGLRWSGQWDLFYRDEMGRYCLEDHKLTSVGEYAVNRREKKWEQQLNLLALLARRHDRQVDELWINAYFRDWSKAKFELGRKDDDYPPTAHFRFPINLWSREEQEEYLAERIALHSQKDPPGCGPEDRWMRGFRVVTPGRDRALKVEDTHQEAVNWLVNAQEDAHRKAAAPNKPPAQAAALQKRLKDLKAATIEEGGMSLRCELYCPSRTICHHKPPSRRGN